MNEADASPGGGAEPVSQAQPQAQSAAPAVAAIPVDAIKEVLATEIKGLKDGIFADLRKAGVFKQERPVEHSNPTSAPQQPPGTPSSASGLSMADVEAMLERERVITARATKNELTDAQVRRMKAALSGVAIESFSTEVDAYLNDMKLVRAAEPVTTNTVPAIQPQANGHPISDKGSPAPGGVVNYERELIENPIGMSSAAYAMLVAKHGEKEAARMRMKAAASQAARISVTTK